MQNINYFALGLGILASSLAIYFLLSLFPKAPWWRADRIKAPQTVPDPYRHPLMASCGLALGIAGGRDIAEAFHHKMPPEYALTIDVILLAAIVFMVFLRRKSKRDNDPSA